MGELTSYQEYILLSRYSRWLKKEKRRETWGEVVKRYMTFFRNRFPKVKGVPWRSIERAILALEVMPSMRCLKTAGEALDRDNCAGFNCSYTRMDRARAFDEIMYMLMCGTGVGFSVERQYISKMPEVAEEMYDSATTIVVNDSKIGWSASFRELIHLLYSGQVPKWDLSKIRAAGAILETFGGRASGPGPLDSLFQFTVAIFRRAAGRRLNSLEVFDIVCKTAEAIVVGGVRRSALICLSNLTDDRMRSAKSGDWRQTDRQREMANISVAYTETPDVGSYLREMGALYDSKSGERGIFNRDGASKLVARLERRDATYDFGTNPCSEILLRDRQFCNLSEVVVREKDTFPDIRRKVRLATILGTMQASLTDYRYLSKKWAENTKEEALLGVSLTGIMDNPLTSGQANGNLGEKLRKLRKYAVEVNKEFSKKLGVNQATAVTCVKPSGTVSQLVDSSSGLHGRFSKHYIRTVRGDNADPITTLMKDQGVPHEPSVGREQYITVFSFPIKSPENSVLVTDLSAITQLEVWKMYALNWCEHKPSVTIYVKDKEWPSVFAWVWENFSILSGVSFLPYVDHLYQQAPYQSISEAAFVEASDKMPAIDWSKLSEYEEEDNTIPELACEAASCEIP